MAESAAPSVVTDEMRAQLGVEGPETTLEVTSTSEDGEIMGVRQRELAGTATPLEGVQFHPESILSEHGHAMLKNFLELRP